MGFTIKRLGYGAENQLQPSQIPSETQIAGNQFPQAQIPEQSMTQQPQESFFEQQRKMPTSEGWGTYGARNLSRGATALSSLADMPAAVSNALVSSTRSPQMAPEELDTMQKQFSEGIETPYGKFEVPEYAKQRFQEGREQYEKPRVEIPLLRPQLLKLLPESWRDPRSRPEEVFDNIISALPLTVMGGASIPIIAKKIGVQIAGSIAGNSLKDAGYSAPIQMAGDIGIQFLLGTLVPSLFKPQQIIDNATSVAEKANKQVNFLHKNYRTPASNTESIIGEARKAIKGIKGTEIGEVLEKQVNNIEKVIGTTERTLGTARVKDLVNMKRYNNMLIGDPTIGISVTKKLKQVNHFIDRDLHNYADKLNPAWGNAYFKVAEPLNQTLSAMRSNAIMMSKHAPGNALFDVLARGLTPVKWGLKYGSKILTAGKIAAFHLPKESIKLVTNAWVEGLKGNTSGMISALDRASKESHVKKVPLRSGTYKKPY